MHSFLSGPAYQSGAELTHSIKCRTLVCSISHCVLMALFLPHHVEKHINTSDLPQPPPRMFLSPCTPSDTDLIILGHGIDILIQIT